jgi:RNA-directed DNA polymerase
MVPNGYSPDDPTLLNSWLNRTHLGSDSNIVSAGQLKIAKKQRHVCPWCFESLYNPEPIEKHHIIPVKDGGPNSDSTLVLLHLACHQAVTQVGQSSSEKVKAQLEKIKKAKVEKGVWKLFDPIRLF